MVCPSAEAKQENVNMVPRDGAGAELQGRVCGSPSSSPDREHPLLPMTKQTKQADPEVCERDSSGL